MAMRLRLFESRPGSRWNQRARRTRRLCRGRPRMPRIAMPRTARRGRPMGRRRTPRCGGTSRRRTRRRGGTSRRRGCSRRGSSAGRHRMAQSRSRNRGGHEEGADRRNGIAAQPQYALHELPPVRRHFRKKAINGFIHLKKILLECAPQQQTAATLYHPGSRTSIANLRFLARRHSNELTPPPLPPYSRCQ